MDLIEFPCPHCGKPIELPESDAGSTRPCPACEEWVLVPSHDEAVIEEPPAEPTPSPAAASPKPALAGAPPAEPAPQEQLIPPPGRSSALSGGWSCLVTGLLLMYFLPQAHLVYLPLFAVAFILGIVALAQGKAIGGQLVLILSLLAPVILGVHVLGLEVPEWARIPGLTDVRKNVDTDESTEETNLVEKVKADSGTTAWAPATERDSGNNLQAGGRPQDSAPAADWGSTSPATDTDWQKRYDFWLEQYSSRFKAPATGTSVTLELAHGATAEGILRTLTQDEVTLQIKKGFVTYERERLSEATRRIYFQEDFARYFAQRRVKVERGGRTTPTAQPPRRSPPPATAPEKNTRGFGDFL